MALHGGGGKLPGGIELNPEAAGQKQSEAVAAEEGRTFDTITQALLGPVVEERTRNIENYLRTLSPSPDEQRRALLYMAAREQIIAEFHRIYRLIYGSQITALKGLNTVGPVTRAQVENITYSEACGRDPEFYANVTFEQWLGFLTNLFLLREDAGRLQITNRGQLFLHFLVQEGLNDYGLPHNSQR